jgi:two-component system, NarL family, capsular synthesis sensor histidine kinase RcsC
METGKIQSRQLSVLIVDDCPMILKVEETLCSAVGYKVLVANDAFEALAMLGKWPVDFVLTDIEMPQMNGFQLAKKIRELYPETLVFGITSRLSSSVGTRNANDDLEELLEKPLLPKTCQWLGQKIS